MPGHGSVITTTSGQDNGSIYVDNNDGSERYTTGTQEAFNLSGGSVNQGDVVSVDWNDSESRLEITAVGTKATGDVNTSGTSITITDSGDTALSGTVSISTKHGENEGYAGATGICCGNVDGEGSYLCE